MVNWLLTDCDIFGLQTQNWMFVFAGGLIAYLAVLLVTQHRQRGV
jgi:hypothetical protein